MDGLKGVFNGSYMPSILALAVLLAASGFLLLLIRESPAMGRGVAKDR